jgi:hypothetical protein
MTIKPILAQRNLIKILTPKTNQPIDVIKYGILSIFKALNESVTLKTNEKMYIENNIDSAPYIIIRMIMSYQFYSRLKGST